MSEKESAAEDSLRGQRKHSRNSLKYYTSSVFQESYICVVSSVANTGSIGRKVFKIIAFLLCLTGFLYQTGTFLATALKYPTSVDIDVRRAEIINAPAYSFCENNGINRKLFCEKYPERCEEPSAELCKNYEYYCGENKSLMPKKKYFSYHKNASDEELIELNRHKTDLIKEIKVGTRGSALVIEEEVTGPYFRKRYTEEKINFLCYSLNDRVNSSSDPVEFRDSPIEKNAINTFRFQVHPNELFLPGNPPGILFELHSPFQGVNPLESGVFMKPGRIYLFFVSVEEELMQRSPYDTDCINYTEIWEENGRTGLRLQEMCRQNCLAEFTVSCLKCVYPTVYFNEPRKYCSEEDFPDDYVDDACSESDKKELAECMYNRCKEDCRRVKYRYTVQERFLGHFDDEGNRIENINNMIEVEIFLEEDEIIMYKHSPKYMIVEVFSSIGGFIGCWLGISLLDITDVFEGFIRIFRYSLKRK